MRDAGSAARRQERIGTADDIIEADGTNVLTFWQAQERSHQWFAHQNRLASGVTFPTSHCYTVSNALTDYFQWFAHNRRSLYATRTVANARILPALGTVEVAKLTAPRLRKWIEEIALSPARRRTRASQAQKTSSGNAPTTHEEIRKRRATANRILTILKAALNHAWRDGKVASDDAWRRVRPFHDVHAPVIRYLTKDECVRLVNAAEASFRQMILAALFTGCRYSEIGALKVDDFNPDVGILTIRMSKSGKTRHVVLTDEGRAFFNTAVENKTKAAVIFTRMGDIRWGTNHQRRPLVDACEQANISPVISFHILRHTHGSMLAMKGVPMAVIAKQLGHADTRMTEKHYAHLSPSYVADTIRQHFPMLGIIDTSNVAPLRRTAEAEQHPSKSTAA